ncbi:hypothetical protein M408DRAFT_166544 [Serendipita vermifera MAFF 305830]|uniref:RNA helicase n=1 Tax=Serendipita vermifera MAFF 305830 TaxID=933852 RepID=A0A0C3B5T0_SERVB|nr:hypothetical protein M408DRAFT_166544 [Serendipita vermifera MAFF 305830]
MFQKDLDRQEVKLNQVCSCHPISNVFVTPFPDGLFTRNVDDFTTSDSSKEQSSNGRRGASTGRNPRSPSRSTPTREVLPHTESSVLANNVSHFSSVPLNTGLLESLSQNLGQYATPTDIQRLSLSHFFKRNPGLSDPSPVVQSTLSSSQTLLASQTGSGKSIAYMLPMLHSIKWRELAKQDEQPDAPLRPQWAPKGLILAPTHELSRQLSRFAKGLCHNIKLRVFCLSQENRGNSPEKKDDMDFVHVPLSNGTAEIEIRREDAVGSERTAHGPQRPVDVMIGTAGRVLDLTRGRQWRDDMEKIMDRNPWERDEPKAENSVGRLNHPDWKPSIDLSEIEWVVMDEADVVYGPDFIQTTEMLLNDIASAKLKRPLSKIGATSHQTTAYPFNLILCTATIPNSLDQYISTKYPSMERLTSVRLHQLPRSITPEHVPYSGGNRAADIATRIRSVWLEEGMERRGEKSKILLFCNKSSKAEKLAQYLNEQDIPTVALVRVLDKGKRNKNNDQSIESFLKFDEGSVKVRRKQESTADGQQEPRVLATTSLLSRGLDFSPSVKHVFIIDEPNNMVDFIHRAGRTGRAGQEGKVVIFSKSRGRGSARAMTGVRGEIMQKVGLRPTRHLVRRPADAFAS